MILGTTWLILTFSLPVLGMPSETIIRRHDRDDARYLELGARYPCVTRLGGGTATLIDQQWLLTAAHVAENLSPFDRYVVFGEQKYAIEGIVMHPKSKQSPRPESVDIAMVKLAKPVSDVVPVSIYKSDDEIGREVVFVGPGMFGDGLTGPQGEDGKMRGATNRVFDAIPGYVKFKFDAPPDATEMEGISGPGDSGGPAIVEIDGTTFVIGVSSANDDGGALGPCRYDSTEYYARVSSVADWVETTKQSPLPSREATSNIVDLRDQRLPDSRAGTIAAAFFDAYANEGDQAIEDFERTYRAESALRDRPVTERISSWRQYRDQWGTLQPLQFVEAGPLSIYVLVRADRERVHKSFCFELETREPHKLTGIAIASPVIMD